jgi:hypothetical protein
MADQPIPYISSLPRDLRDAPAPRPRQFSDAEIKTAMTRLNRRQQRRKTTWQGAINYLRGLEKEAARRRHLRELEEKARLAMAAKRAARRAVKNTLPPPTPKSRALRGHRH